MKIGYFADGPWAHKAFEKMAADHTLEIVFMVLRYDSQDEVLKRYARQYSIPCLVNKNINSDEFLEIIQKYGAQLFVSMSFNQIFRKKMIELPEYKTINCHAGKLPFYRGRNILNWVLINDEKEFGITVHYLDEGIDTGDILLQRTYPITDDDSYGTLLERAYTGCADILYDAVKLIQDGHVSTVAQRDLDPEGTYFGRRTEGDEIIDWNQTSRELFNFIRAVSDPGPRATTFVNGHIMKINKSAMIQGAHVYKNTVGQVVGKSPEGLIVKTKDTTLLITEYECEANVKIGDKLKPGPIGNSVG